MGRKTHTRSSNLVSCFAGFEELLSLCKKCLFRTQPSRLPAQRGALCSCLLRTLNPVRSVPADVAEARGAPGEERVPAGEACAVAPEEARAFAERVSLEEFERQRSEYTRRAVDELVRSPEYQRRTNSCQS